MQRTEFVAVFAYDVSAAKVRAKIAARLEEIGVRVQMSVFEARLTEVRAGAIAEEIESLLEPGDKIRLYLLDKDSARRSRTKGGPPLPENHDFWLL